MNLAIGQLTLGSVPRVVAAISDSDISKLDVETVERVDVLELRIDMFENQSPDYVEKVFNSTKIRFDKPIIATLRTSDEGGFSKLDDNQKYELFERVMSLSDAIDVEVNSEELLKRIVSLCKADNKLVIGSYHNLDNTPGLEDLTNIVARTKQCGADIVKIAVKANTRSDVSKLASFTEQSKGIGLITISLGPIGQISRVFNPIIGSLMTYGHLGSPSVIGQLSALDIVEYLRIFDAEYNEDLINRLHLLEFA
ncbi:MAG TPA: type I 3-dehydroquinate dehydratase [Nitrospirae bacterium]|nr:3-dehydroquinate dehydratase [bacterium BMS3Abin10]GBE37691.1 3-dehydroquinate dehydratase [bacterium BMS3Bbin08]HDH50554.1 type I 3-dehydroquinate dehydratase [Nitrospirota bacterium]HDK16812.1 type I 3-dehydroquinate dehydratase [Nitrospirota bacterium]HDK82245.1 type I 3-dehydroquinate dehydratase [Nitrospirota bacterium]